MTTATASDTEPAYSATTPQYRKTASMIEVEHRFGDRDIRELLIAHIDAEPRLRDVADRLGILHSTCSRWVSDLGLQNYAKNVRRNRRSRAA